MSQHPPPRKAYSMAQPQNYYYENQHQINNGMQHKHVDYHQYHYQPQSTAQQQQPYYQQPMNTGTQFVENLQFSPPRIDESDEHPPQAAHPNTYMNAPMLPPHGAAGYSMHQLHPMQPAWPHQRPVDRKVSCPVYSYNKADGGTAKQAQAREMMNYNATAHQHQMAGNWNQEHNGIVTAQRKITPVETYNQMLSPPTAMSTSHVPGGSQHIQSPALSSPMEIDRKPSDRFIKKFSREEPKKDHKVPERKASCMAAKSHLRFPREGQGVTYTPPPILPPMRNGSGLYWKLAKSLATINQGSSGVPDGDEMPSTHNGSDDMEMSDGSPGLKPDGLSPDMLGMDHGWAEIDNHHQPARKNGLAYMQHQMGQVSDQLEALRKESNESDISHRTFDGRSLFRKDSGHLRKESNISEGEEFDIPEETYRTNANPHINIDIPSRNEDGLSKYQAKVKKWKQREDTEQLIKYLNDTDKDAYLDQDVMVFNPQCLEGLTDEQITSFEHLTSSQAGMFPGSNIELALHIIYDNVGNLLGAANGLLQDTNWMEGEDHGNIKYYDYSETTEWTPMELTIFEDAMFEFKKDFKQVKERLPDKTVRECVEFYYTWKKVSPDAYAKLKKNLRAQLGIEQAMNSTLQDTTDAFHKASIHDKPISPSTEMSRLSTAEPYQGLEDYKDFTETPMQINTNENIFGIANSVSPQRESFLFSHHMQSTPSPSFKSEMIGNQKSHAPMVQRHPLHQSGGKKGAQPSADGMFHCRLCEKSFEKVKSLNAHMKSHAMKARAEQEAKSQVEQQMNAAAVPPQVQLNVNGMNGVNGVNPFPTGLAMNFQQLAQNMPQHLLQLNNILNAQGQLNGFINANSNNPQHSQQQQQLISQLTNNHQPVIH